MDTERKRIAKDAEINCRGALERDGWKVYFARILDFVCLKDDQIMFAEAKSPNIHLRHDQYQLLLRLSGYRIKCCFYSPDKGFIEIKQGVPRP